MNRLLLVAGIVIVVGAALLYSTCGTRAPQAPEDVAQKNDGGFKTLPTAPRMRERVVAELARATPVQPTLAPKLPTPAVESEVELPDDFPGDIPIYKDAKPFAVQDLANDAKHVLFRVDATTPEVFNYYRDEMHRGGWNADQEYQASAQSFLSFRKGDMTTMMTISQDPKTGKQLIGIRYEKEKPLPFAEF